MERGRERASIHPLVHLPNAHNKEAEACSGNPTQGPRGWQGPRCSARLAVLPGTDGKQGVAGTTWTQVSEQRLSPLCTLPMHVLLLRPHKYPRKALSASPSLPP